MRPRTPAVGSLFSESHSLTRAKLYPSATNSHKVVAGDDSLPIGKPTKTVNSSTKNAVIGHHNNLAGKKAEEIVATHLERLLAELGLMAEFERGKGPYDWLLRISGKVLYVEVKSTYVDGKEVKNAFRRPHPEPFIVILLHWVTRELRIFTEPTNGIKLTKYTLRRVLRKLGVI